MDVGMMMVFASYGWESCPDDRVWDEEIRLARLAADSAYRTWPADPLGIAALRPLLYADTTMRRRAERELRREVAGSPHHAQALRHLANFALWEGRWDDAASALVEALRLEPFLPNAREMLGVIALQQGRPREALRWFEQESRILRLPGGLDLHRGQVAQALGDLPRARRCYERELRRDPASQGARDSLDSVSARLGR